MPYPSDVTDAEWVKLKALFPEHSAKGRPWLWDPREYLNAILYVLRNRCPWRSLPPEYPPWQSVYSRFRLWKRKGTLRKILEAPIARPPRTPPPHARAKPRHGVPPRPPVSRQKC